MLLKSYKVLMFGIHGISNAFIGLLVLLHIFLRFFNGFYIGLLSFLPPAMIDPLNLWKCLS